MKAHFANHVTRTTKQRILDVLSQQPSINLLAVDEYDVDISHSIEPNEQFFSAELMHQRRIACHLRTTC